MGGTCWMKQGPISKNNAIFNFEQDSVCGVKSGSGSNGLGGTGPNVNDGKLWFELVNRYDCYYFF